MENDAHGIEKLLLKTQVSENVFNSEMSLIIRYTHVWLKLIELLLISLKVNQNWCRDLMLNIEEEDLP